MGNNGNECIEEYAVRRNRIGYYFCTECKHNHKLDSPKGIEHIEYDLLYDVVIKKDTEQPNDKWLVRFENLKKLRISKKEWICDCGNRVIEVGLCGKCGKLQPKQNEVKPQTDNDLDLYARFKENQQKWKNRA